MQTKRPSQLVAVHQHLQVSDMKRSIDFYVTILGYYYDHGVRDMAWLTLPDMLLTLSPGSPEPCNTQYIGYTCASFAVLDEWYAWLRQRGVRLSAPPAEHDDRAYFFLYDPDDYPIAFSIASLDYPEKLQGQAEMQR